MVAILLSTYNGEKYITAQIDSITNQTFTDWRLYIRDDGSNDKTLSIINEYCKKDSRIKLLYDRISHRGVKGSFNYLMSKVESEYYMFCDQDDIWQPNKIEESVNAISNIAQDVPALACVDLALVNHNLEIINQSMWNTHHLTKLIHDKNGLLIAPMFPGCTMIFNNAAKKLALKETYNFPLHDIQISMVVYKNNGTIKTIPKSLIMYRQHGKNVVGLYSGNKWFANKIKNFKKTLLDIIAYYRISHEYLNTSAQHFLILKIKHLFNLL